MVAIGINNNFTVPLYTLLIWDWQNQNIIETLPYGGQVIRFLSDGRLATQWDVSRINVWNLTTGQFDLSLGYGATALEQLSNGYLASAGFRQVINIWNVTNGALVQSIPLVSSDHTFLKQTCIDNYFASTDTSGNVFIWDSTSYTLVHDFNIGQGNILYMESLPSSDCHLLTASQSGRLQIWNIQTRTCLGSFIPFYFNSITGLKVLSNETILVYTSAQNHILIVGIDEISYRFSVVNRISLYDMPHDLAVSTSGVLLVTTLTSFEYCNIFTQQCTGVAVPYMTLHWIEHMAALGKFLII
jgi:hypothetical protein